jgi:hypothetical protein
VVSKAGYDCNLIEVVTKAGFDCNFVTRGVMVIVLNATFNNISVLLVEETGVPGENHQPVSSH